MTYVWANIETQASWLSLCWTVSEKKKQDLVLTEDKCRRDAWWFVLWLSYQLELLTAALVHLYKSFQLCQLKLTVMMSCSVNHISPTASTDLRLSVQGYTLLLNCFKSLNKLLFLSRNSWIMHLRCVYSTFYRSSPQWMRFVNMKVVLVVLRSSSFSASSSVVFLSPT